MIRPLIWTLFVTLMLAPGAARGQAVLGPKGPVRTEAEPPPDEPQTFRLTIDPAPEPVPALRHALVTPYLDQKPGNAVPFYYRAILSYQDWIQRVQQRDQEFWNRFEKWMNTPLEELPRDEVWEMARMGAMFRHLQIAAAREEVKWDWRLRDLEGMEAIGFLLSDIQEARGLARMLTLKARLEIAEGRYDDALETFRVGYALAQAVAEPPILINTLVGIAIAASLDVQLIELIGAPESPNLYWALTELSDPFIDMRHAMRHEMALPAQMFPFLRDSETTERTPEEWTAVVVRAVEQLAEVEPLLAPLFGQSDLPRDEAAARAAATVLILRGYPRAKQELIEAGHAREEVDRMAVGQVIAIHQGMLYRYISDEMRKLSLLPYAEARERARLVEESLMEEGYLGPAGTTRETIPITSMFLPAVRHAMTAQARLDSRFAGLRVLEAIRMHAAANDGRLPKSLDEITVVPVPHNPMTGKPFPYRFENGTAILDVPPEPGMIARIGRRFEITLRQRD